MAKSYSLVGEDKLLVIEALEFYRERMNNCLRTLKLPIKAPLLQQRLVDKRTKVKKLLKVLRLSEASDG